MGDKQLRDKFYDTFDQELRFTKEDRNKVFKQVHKMSEEFNPKKKWLVFISKLTPHTVSLLAVSLCIILFVPLIFQGNFINKNSGSDVNGVVSQNDKGFTAQEEIVNGKSFSDSSIAFNRSLLSLSKSEHNFYPERTLPPGVVEIGKDRYWNSSLNEVLKTMTETDVLPAGIPLYDLGLYGDEKIFRFKVWEESETLILKDLDTGKHYISTGKEAVEVLGMIGNLMKDIKK